VNSARRRKEFASWIHENEGSKREAAVSEFLVNVATVLGGVIGSLIGFVMIGAVVVLLVLPYVLTTWRKPRRSAGDPLRPTEDRPVSTQY
jgi:hypothetical protein